MSTRMFQRALKTNQAKDSLHSIPSDVQQSDSEPDETHGVASNPFDLLGEEDDKTEDVDVERFSDQQSAAGSASTSAPLVSSKSKRRKNKGKKKSTKDAGKGSLLVDDLESIDTLLERLAIANAKGSSSTPVQNTEFPNILAIDTKYLRAEDELRRIFGSKVINSADGEAAGSHRRRQGSGTRRTGRSVPLRKSVLVVPMDHWPRWDGGISMDCIKVEGQIQYFRYQYSPKYQEVQKYFESCVKSHDPNTLVMLLRDHPYHVDTLLALAEVYKQMGEHQHSADLLEQCLYALECAWHPLFNQSMGACRLEFSCDANRALFLSLFRHMQQLGRRGCHRTAVEVCKLLLSLDPSDPLGALFCIDYFALRAEQYEWLERFVEEYESDKSILLFPNFSFSVAVAGFHLEQRQPHGTSLARRNWKEGSVSLANGVSSVELLQQALMLHPAALKKILEKAPIKEDYSWNKITTHFHFSQATGGSPTLEHLINIYVERNCLIWRSPDLQKWLKEAAGVITQIAETTDSHYASEISNWQYVRKEMFRSNDNEYKHLRVFDFSDTVSRIPPEEMPQLGFHQRGDFEGDEVLGQATALFEQGNIQQAVQLVASQGRNALGILLQSLVPWMDMGGQASIEEAPALLEDETDQNDSIPGDDGNPL